jgi:hypothetical protein
MRKQLRFRWTEGICLKPLDAEDHYARKLFPDMSTYRYIHSGFH